MSKKSKAEIEKMRREKAMSSYMSLKEQELCKEHHTNTKPLPHRTEHDAFIQELTIDLPWRD